jgi:uncharacterized protein (DUF342 family)
MVDISVIINEEKTSAELHLRKVAGLSLSDPLNQDNPVELEAQISRILESEGIVHGIRHGSIKQVISEIITGSTQSMAIVAKATSPKKEIPSHFLFAPKFRVLSPIFQAKEKGSVQVNVPEELPTLPSQGPISPKDSAMDFREVRSYLVVNQDELLAIQKPMTPGEFGTDILGQMIPYKTAEIFQPEPKSGVYEKEGRLYAQLSGKFTYDDTSFWIDTKIVVSGDLDFHYGNIRFPGDLEIKGNVKDQFKIWIGGDLIAHHTLDVFQIMVGGSVQVAEGIVGRQKGLLRSKKNITARYIENCFVECLGPVKVARSIFTSHVMCRGEILIPKGKIIGGTTKALNLVEVMELGNRAEIHTEVILGLDFVVERQVSECSERQQKIVRERKALVTSFQAKTLSKEMFDGKIARLTQEEDRINEMLMEKLPLLDINDTAILKVYGKVYPGVFIRICSLKLAVDQALSGVEFFIDKSVGLIRHRKIGEGQGEGKSKPPSKTPNKP